MKTLGSFQVPVLASAPALPVAGQIYFNSTSNKLLGWNGTAWVSLESDGGNSDTVDGMHASDFMTKGPVTWNQLKGV